MLWPLANNDAIVKSQEQDGAEIGLFTKPSTIGTGVVADEHPEKKTAP